MCMKSSYLLPSWALVMVFLCIQPGQGCSLLGGQITWRLDDDFETSRTVTFTMRTAWHKFDCLDNLSGGKVVEGETLHFISESQMGYMFGKFGKLQVRAGDTTQNFPNKFIVDSIDGNVVEGQIVETASIPTGVFKGDASIVQIGLRDELLPKCKIPDPTRVPCEMYMNCGEPEPMGEQCNPNPLDLFTTFTLPRPEETSKFYMGKIRNRNSPVPFPRPVIQLSQGRGAPMPTFPFPAFDLDGLPSVVHYPARSTKDGPGNINLGCANGNVLTSYGCNGRDSSLDRPPFVGSVYSFVTTHKIAVSEFYGYPNSEAFFYSFTFVTTDGTDIVTSEMVINYCSLWKDATYTVAPEFVILDSAGNIVRNLPNTTITCLLSNPCTITVYAAQFVDVTGTQLKLGDTPSIAVSGPQTGGRITNTGTLSNGVARLDYSLGNAPNWTHTHTEIGRYKIVCFYAKSSGPCRSSPLCYKVKILGSSPFFVPPTPPMVLPTDDIKINEVTDTMVCAGFEVSFTIRAVDPDPGDLVRIDVTDSTGDGMDLFAPPYNAVKVGNYSGTTPIASVAIAYTLDYANGFAADPVTRRVSLAKDRQICSIAVDNTLHNRLAFGSLPDGNFRSPIKCHKIVFSGPPTFITTFTRVDGTPFNSLFGTLEERVRVVDAFYGLERTVTFRAQDPNLGDNTTIFFLDDPGVPNGVDTGTSLCEPQFIPVAWSPVSIFSECSIASRTIRWTPDREVDSKKKHSICAVPRDNAPKEVCPSDKMTADGWYGETHCVDIRVIPPAIDWTNRSAIGRTNMSVINAYVPCTMEYIVEAADSAVGVNTASQLVSSPYKVTIEVVGDLPQRATLRAEVQGRLSTSMLLYRANRGDEGREDIVCMQARDFLSTYINGPICVVIRVRRCAYCLEKGDTLQTIMQEMIMDFNWLRVWVANGNDDGDDDTVLVENPDVLRASIGVEKQVINVGSLYTVQLGETLTELAGRFQTTLKKLLLLNPDVNASLPLPVDQELCIVPCS